MLTLIASPYLNPTGGVHLPGARSGRAHQQPHSHAPVPEIPPRRGGPSDPRGPGPSASRPSVPLRRPPAEHHGPPDLLHRGAQGDGQRRLPPDRRHAGHEGFGGSR